MDWATKSCSRKRRSAFAALLRGRARSGSWIDRHECRRRLGRGSSLMTAEGPGVPVLAFGSHLDVDGRRAAKAAGVTRVLSNGDFHRDMVPLVQRYAKSVLNATLTPQSPSPRRPREGGAGRVAVGPVPGARPSTAWSIIGRSERRFLHRTAAISLQGDHTGSPVQNPGRGCHEGACDSPLRYRDFPSQSFIA